MTHCIALKSILSHFEGRDISKLWEPPVIHQTSLSLIEYDNKKGEMMIPFIEPYSTYKMYPGHIYLIEKTHEGKILIK